MSATNRPGGRVGFVGVGRMGRPMAERAMIAGFAISAFNRSPESVTTLAAAGAVTCHSLEEIAAGSEVVVTVLPTIAAVESVYEHMATAARPGQIFIDHSTVGPAVARRCADLLRGRGADYLDAPVSGGPDGAASGTLTIMAGGTAETFKAVLTLLRAYGKHVRLCGPVGSGQAMKLVNQLLTAANAMAVAEATVLAGALGLELPQVLETVSTAYGNSRMLERNLQRMIADDRAADAPVRLYVKDLGIIAEEANSAGFHLPLAEMVLRILDVSSLRGLGNDDISRIVEYWKTGHTEPRIAG